MKPSGIGGMAVIEGVMMKNKDEYAIAVRKPNNEIIVDKKKHKDFAEKVKLFKLPIFRGILAFVDSMVVGIKVLNFSASFFEEEEEAAEKEKKDVSEKGNALLMALAVIASLAISISLFMVLPVLVSNLFAKRIDSIFVLSLMEGILRLVIFIGYILLASQMKEIKRVFMYHGAEHKTINCLENGFELTVENVKWQSKAHKRCGTSFMLLVMLISLVFFIVLRPPTLMWRILSRILLVPAIAGLSYEFIRLAGKSENKVVNILSKPGLWMQSLTTKEPDDEMIEVAIQSVDAVFDWRGFLEIDKAQKPKRASSRGKQAARESVKKSADVQEKLQAAEDSKVKETKKSNKNPDTKKAQDDPKAQEDKKTKEDKKVLEDNKVSQDSNIKQTKGIKDVKKGSAAKKKEVARNEYAAASEITIARPKDDYEEDDEILKALDKYLDFSDDN